MKTSKFKISGKTVKTALIVVFCAVTAICNYINIRGLYSKDAVVSLSSKETTVAVEQQSVAQADAATKELSSEPQAATDNNSSILAGSDSENNSLININTASKEQLMTLKGIGESKASAIIEYRKAYNGFLSTEEITEVKGIGEKIYANIKDLITVE